MPESLVEIVRLPGLGAKTARRLWQELDITTLAELEAAARAGRLAGPRGLRRAQGAAAPRRSSRRAPRRASACSGSTRRSTSRARCSSRCARTPPASAPTRPARCAAAPRRVGDVDVIAAAADGARADGLARSSSRSSPRCSATARRRPRSSPTTASSSTCASCRPRATATCCSTSRARRPQRAPCARTPQRRGMSVSEWGIEDEETGEVFRTPDEDEVYRHLGYQPIPPELREDNGELELRAPQRAAGARRARATCAATCTCTATGAATASTRCSTWSRPCAPHGHEYMAITDHSAGVGMGIGLEADDVRRQIEAVRPHPRDARRLRPAGRLRGRHHGRRLALSAGRPAGRARLGRRVAARRAATGLRPHHEAAAGRSRASVRRRHRAPVGRA